MFQLETLCASESPMRFKMKRYAFQRETPCTSGLDDMMTFQHISWTGVGAGEMEARGQGARPPSVGRNFLGKKSIHLRQTMVNNGLLMG